MSELLPTPTGQEVEHPEAILTPTKRRDSKDMKNSHSLNLADTLTLLPVDSPASLFPQQESDEARKMTATSGQRCLRLFNTSNPNGSSLKMFMDSLLGATVWYSNKCVLTWKAKVTKSNRLLFQLFPSMRRTAGIESGLLQERLLMTPKAGDATFASGSTSGRSREMSTHLPTQIKLAGAMLPTVTTGDRRSAKSRQQVINNVVAMLPTPQASDFVGTVQERNYSIRHLEHNSGWAKDQTGTKIGLKLQPNFVEWMMGYPKGWLDFPMEPQSPEPSGDSKH